MAAKNLETRLSQDEADWVEVEDRGGTDTDDGWTTWTLCDAGDAEVQD